MLAALILGTVVDGALALLLVGVAGYIFGGGPEGANGATTPVVLWCLGLAGTMAAPVGGFVLRAYRRAGWGVLLAFVPPAIAAFFVSL